MSITKAIITGVLISLPLTALTYLLFKFVIIPFKNYIIAFKELPRALVFINDLDKKYPIGKITPEQQEMREKILIMSGLNPKSIELAQNKKGNNTVKVNEINSLVKWYLDNLNQGIPLDRSREILLYDGWKKRLVKKAYKLAKKNERGLLKYGNTTRYNPNPTSTNGLRARDGATPRSSLLPLPSTQLDSRDNRTVKQLEQGNSKVNREHKRDWNYFKSNGGNVRGETASKQ